MCREMCLTVQYEPSRTRLRLIGITEKNAETLKFRKSKEIEGQDI